MKRWKQNLQGKGEETVTWECASLLFAFLLSLTLIKDLQFKKDILACYRGWQKAVHKTEGLALEDLRFSLRRHTGSWNVSNNPIFLTLIVCKSFHIYFPKLIYWASIICPFYTWENEPLIRETVTRFKVRDPASGFHLQITPYISHGQFMTNVWLFDDNCKCFGGFYTAYSKLFVSKMIYVIKTDFLKRFMRKAICSKGRKTWQGNGESKSEYGIMYVFTKDF